MNLGKRISHFAIWLGIFLLQLIMTQVVTFFLSLFLPGLENFPQTRPALFVALVGITFSIGIFFAGWLALKLRGLVTEPRYPARIIATLVGTYLPLIVALVLYHPLEPGNPFFFVSMLTGILGFHAPGWIE